MPTYEYSCAAGHRFERVQRMSEPVLTECPECGAAAERLLSAGAGLLFKGSGFYITDYRSDAYKKAAAADSGGGSGDSGSSAGSASGSTGSDAGSKKSEPAAGKSEPSSKSSSKSSGKSGGESSGTKDSGGSSSKAG